MKKVKLNSQNGSIAVITAILLPVLIAVIALSVDIGYIVHNRQKMQVAADSAALVAAGSLLHGQDISNASQLAFQATAANGYLNNQNSIKIEISNPPTSSSGFAGDLKYVQVTVKQDIPPFLAWIYGVTNTQTSATAVAGPAGNAMPCMVTLESAAAKSLTIGGSAIVNAKSCGVYVNSTSQTALALTGNANLLANPIQVVGDFTLGSSATMSPVTSTSTVMTDPFRTIQMPSFAGCTYINYLDKSSKNLVLTPGTYCGGITISGNHSVTLSDGLYVLYGGGLNVGGGVTLFEGKNVSFYNTGASSIYPYGNIQLTGSSVLNLEAPLTGNLAGMLFMQDPLNNLQANIRGNSGSVLAGNFYFPNANINLTGSSGSDIPIGAVVARTVSVTGNNKLNMTNTYGAAIQGGSTRSALYQ